MIREHPEWALGFEDENWWSRVAQPSLSAWAANNRPLRLVQQTVTKDDPEPTALARYGLLVRWHHPQGTRQEQTWLRFVDGRPVSDLTTQFLAWSCARLQAVGKTALLLVWDNASWHTSGLVRQWIATHNHAVKQTGKGVRIIVCCLPVKSPWLNPIEPQWVHGKRKVVEPARLLTAQAVAERVCAHFRCVREPPLTMPQQAA